MQKNNLDKRYRLESSICPARVGPVFLFFAFFLLLPTHHLYAQDRLAEKKINLELKELSLKEAFLSLQKQSGINFVFSSDFETYASRKVSVSEKEITAKSAIELLLKDTELQYTWVDDQVVIDGRPAQQQKSQSTGSGSLKGRIVEAETSEPLIGATIRVLGTERGTMTNLDGYYSFENLPAGRHTIEVAYMGYTTRQVAVNIAASRTATYDVVLSVDSKLLDEVVISGVRRERGSVPHASVGQVTQEIKELKVVASGISAEQISKSADRNAADVVKKISGVSVRDDKFIVVRGMNERYNLTYLNDNLAPSTELYSRAFALNLLPTRIIDKILVYKSPSPEMLGDMAGGAVKIYTKDAIAVKHFDVELNIGIRPTTAFNNNFLTYEGGKYDFLGFDDGTRVLPNTVPGYGDFTKAKISQKQYAGSFSNILQYRKKQAMPNLQLTANYYDAFNVFDRTLSMLTSFSYKNESKQNEVGRSQRAFSKDISTTTYNLTSETQSQETAQMTLLQNFSYRVNNRINLRFKNFLLQQGETNTVIKGTQNAMLPNREFEDAPIRWIKINRSEDDKNIVLGYTQRFLYSGNLTGNIAFDDDKRHELNWNTGYIYSLQHIPDQRLIRLKRNRDGYINHPVDDLHWLAAVRSTDPEKNDVDRGIISRTWTQNAENATDASMDYTGKLFSWLTFRTGTYHQWKKRILFRRAYTVNEGDLNDTGYAFSGTISGNGNYMDYNRVLFKEQDLGRVWSDYYLNDEGVALKVFDRTRGSDAYTATEQTNSGYAAIAFTPFDGKIDLYGGVRAEYNRQRVAGAIPEGVIAFPSPGGVDYPILIDNEKLSWLPSVNLSLKPWEWIVLRGAYGKTVNRPEFRELSPYSELDYLGNQIIYGNSKLISSDITGYDARVEYYFGSDRSNLVSVGGFYKEINRPIERMISSNLSFGYPANITFANADNATVKGLEAEVLVNMDFIRLPVVRNLSISANYSCIESEVVKAVDEGATGWSDINKFAISRQLQGQAPYMFNAGVYYENPAWGTRLSLLYNEIGERIYAASVGISQKQASEGTVYPEGGYTGSLIELPRRQLDLSISQRISKGLQVKFSVQNLLNEAVRVAEDQNFTYKYEPTEYVRRHSSEELFYYNVEGDIIASEYKLDRFFNLTISYSF